MSALQRALAAILCISALATVAAAETIQQYKLPNGLTVILAPMAQAERVSIVTRYDVGSADEPKGRSGFAHLFEHLMFEGTRAVPDYDQAASALGAEQNAFTGWDSTTYYIAGPREYLPKYLRLEADRMANLANAVTQEDLDNQRAVIGNELRERTLDNPGGAAQEQSLSILAGQEHPYGHSAIGSVADLAAAKLDDIKGFHRAYYVPGNAVVTVTGNFDPAAARQMIDQTFGIVPQGKVPARTAEKEFKPSAERLSFTDAVETPTVALMWNGPTAVTREDAIYLAINYALSSDAGPLYEKLVQRDKLASNAWVSWDSRRLGGVFAVKAKAAKGVTAEKLEAGLKADFSEILKEGLTAQRLRAASESIASSYDTAIGDATSFGFILEQAEADSGDALAWRRLAEIASSLTPGEANAVLRKLAGEQAVVVTVNPGQRNKELPPILVQSTGSSEPIQIQDRPDVEVPDLPALASAAFAIPKPEIYELSNGIPVALYKNKDQANSALVLNLPIGLTATSGVQAGLADVALDLSARGAGDMGRAEFSSAFEEAGIRLSESVASHASAVVLTAPARNLARGVELLATAIFNPRFEEGDWQTQISQYALSLEQANSRPDYVASAEGGVAPYPGGTAEGQRLTAATVRGLKMADAEALYRKMFRPDQVRLQVISSMPAKDVMALLEAGFGKWATPADLAALPVPVEPRYAERELRFDVAGATQSAILLEFAAPRGFTREAVAFELAVNVLAGSSNSRLNKLLREEKGWSYGISGGTGSGDKGQSNAMGGIFATVQADRTADTLTEIRRNIAALTEKPISESELAAAKQEMRSDLTGAFETTPSFAWVAASMGILGYDFAEIGTKLKLIDELTVEEVRAQALSLTKLPIITVVAGDPTKMQPKGQ